MKKKGFRVGLAAAVLCAGLAWLLCSLHMSRHGLTCTHYTVSTGKVDAPVRIVHLTDLHNREFGEKNAQLVELVARQEPDLIALTGDMLCGDERSTQVIAELTGQLSEIAPVYASLGNHEKAHALLYKTDFEELYAQAGAQLLERGYADVSVGGQTLRIGGLLGYALPEKYLVTGEAKADECEFLREFENTPHYTVLLCHYPLCFLQNHVLEDWNFDCVLTGHFHGGVVRLPLIGGLYAPDIGLFPGRIAGVYESADRQRAMVLSRGLGNSSQIPRLGNIPEVVVLDIIPQE